MVYRLGKNNPPVVSYGSVCIYSVAYRLLDNHFLYKFLRKICKSFFSCPNLIHEGSYPEPSADFQPIFGHKNKEDDPKVVFFLCFSLSPCNDYQLVAVLCPNLIHYQFSGEDGIRTRGASCPARQFSKLLVSATHPPLRGHSLK